MPSLEPALEEEIQAEQAVLFAHRHRRPLLAESPIPRCTTCGLLLVTTVM